MPQAPHSVPSPHAADNRAFESVAFDTNGSDPEKHPLPARVGILSRARILGPVTKDHGDIPLLICSFVSGLVDGASFRNWGMFVSMQTGNTVILGLSTAGLPANPHAWLTTLVSIVSFLLGAFLCFRISKRITPEGPNRNRLWASSLFMIQALLILLSAALATPTGLIPQNPRGIGRYLPDPESVIHNIRIVSLIPPLAFQSGVQIATSRLLGFNELPVNVLTRVTGTEEPRSCLSEANTAYSVYALLRASSERDHANRNSTYCDLMGDFKLFATNNVRRDRRAASVVLLLIGSIISGWMLRSQGGLMSVLWLGGGIKFLAAIGVFFFMPTLTEDVVKA